MDTSQITVENIAAVIGVGIVSAWLAARKYLAQLKAPTSQTTTDIVVAGAALADMRPIAELVELHKAQLIEQRRIADALIQLAIAAEQNAEEEEIERRAKMRAAEIVAAGRRRV